eukprot:9981175-Lingulodinium_polyedra.AAC.1
MHQQASFRSVRSVVGRSICLVFGARSRVVQCSCIVCELLMNRPCVGHELAMALAMYWSRLVAGLAMNWPWIGHAAASLLRSVRLPF